MKLRSLTSCFASLTLVFVTASAVEVGDVAPYWDGLDVEGDVIHFPQVTEGAPVVLLFWATWCPYCKAFIPHLKNIQEDYAELGVKVFAINVSETGDARAYIENLGFPLRTIVDGDPIAIAYGIRYTPGLLVVDGAGTVVYRRASTNPPPGQSLSEMWSQQVREALDSAAL